MHQRTPGGFNLCGAPTRRVAALLLAITLACSTPGSAVAQAPPVLDTLPWGREILARIDSAFWMQDRLLYANEAIVGKPGGASPAYMWGCGVQLSALAAAARTDAKYRKRLRDYFGSLESYWRIADNRGGYDVLPGPKPLDRYYDDNAWIVLALLDAYETSHERTYLDRATETLQFVLSGEDGTLGGGIYWREQEKTSKNTCANAPAALSALRIYELTHKKSYLETGERLYRWTVDHLQDKDGLFFDHVSLDGSVDRTKWTYNSAVMLRAACLRYRISRDTDTLAEIQRVASACTDRWVDEMTGGIRDGAAFAHMLLEAFLAVYDVDGDVRWLQTVARGIEFLHDHARDVNGFYGDYWANPVLQPLTKLTLLNQASAARILMVASRYTMVGK